VLENTKVDFLSSYYYQNGDNAAVSGRFGSEEVIFTTRTVVISIPLNNDDLLIIIAGISAHTSLSSSNIDPFDSCKLADPFVASSGAFTDLRERQLGYLAKVQITEMIYDLQKPLLLKHMIISP